VLRLALVLLAIAAPNSVAFAQSIKPLPFVATYAVSYRGYEAGRLHVELRAEDSDRFVYETRAEPGVVARFFVGKNPVERSEMRIDEQGVHPLLWMNRGTSGAGTLEFSWEEGTVSGTVEGEQVEHPIEPGLQDRLSIQIAVMTALLRGMEPGTIPMVEGDEIKHYSYTRIGSEQVPLANGEIETIVYESTRPGSSRVSRVWHVPALDYIPIRAERIRKGRVETLMVLVNVQAR
jgi:hypothetical protein